MEFPKQDIWYSLITYHKFLRALRMKKMIIYQSPDSIALSERDNLTNPGMRELAEEIFQQIKAGLIDTVVIEGPPGVGKTTLMNHLDTKMIAAKMPFDTASNDDDVLPRSQRGNKEVVEFHPGKIVREVLDMRANGGGKFEFDAYNTATGEIDLPTTKNLHQKGESTLFIEGVRSIENVMKWATNIRSEQVSRILFLLLQKPEEIIEKQRLERDIKLKGLSEEEVRRRIRTQRKTLHDYYKDLSLMMKNISNLSNRKGAEVIKRKI